MYAYTFIYLYTYTHTYLFTRTYTYIYTYKYIQIQVNMYIYTYTYIYTYNFIYLPIHIHTYLHIHIFIYTHTHTLTYPLTYAHFYIHSISFYLVTPQEVALIAKLRGRTLESCYFQRGSPGRLPRPRRSWRGGNVGGAGGGVGGSAGRVAGGGRKSTGKTRGGEKGMVSRIVSFADVLRIRFGKGSEVDASDRHVSVDPKVPELDRDEAEVWSEAMSLGALLLSGHHTPHELQRLFRRHLRGNGAATGGLSRLVAPSWVALAGWVLAVVVAVVHATGLISNKARAGKRL